MTRERYGKLLILTAAFSLLSGGIGHRHLVAQIGSAIGRSQPLSRALAALPMQIDEWHGADVPLADGIESVPSFDDAYIYRRYTNQQSNRSLYLFVGYTGRRRAKLGHRPDVCYAAHGWDQISHEPVTVDLSNGRVVSCLLYEFRRPDFLGPMQMVLAVYMVDGRYCSDPASYNRRMARNPRLLAARGPYRARIQISVAESGDRNSDVARLKDFASTITLPVQALLPYFDE